MLSSPTGIGDPEKKINENGLIFYVFVWIPAQGGNDNGGKPVSPTFMSFYHQNLAAGRWQTLSLAEQMGNIGSEVSRAKNWQGRDEKFFQGAFERALELLDLTLADSRWTKRLKELTRAREALCDAAAGGREYQSTLCGLESYFNIFASAARKNR